MARKPVTQRPPKEGQQDLPLDEGTHGFPADGEEFSEGNDDNLDPKDALQGQDEDGEGDSQNQPPKKEPWEERLERLEAQNLQLQRELAASKQPPQPQQQSKQPDPADDEPDWDTLLFQDPKKALKLHGERVAKQVQAEMRSEYSREKNQERFWSGFYGKHGDLKDDHDLVQSTMNKNLDELANLPVEQASDRLAELTRQRILRYSGGKQQKSSKKAVAEGNNPPTARRQQEEPPAPTTLVDLLKVRRQRRQQGTAA